MAGTENRYRQPIFQGHAIGCERCHGPGELHVRKPEPVGDELPNIVNPAKLQPMLREAVCQQCHLQGDIRVVRAGRSLTDYRPGLPLPSIESVFVKAENFDKTRFFGQVEQMSESRCFRESRARWAASPAMTHTSFPTLARKQPTTGIVASTVMLKGDAASRSPSDCHRAGTIAALIVTCRDPRTNRSLTRPRHSTSSSASKTEPSRSPIVDDRRAGKTLP